MVTLCPEQGAFDIIAGPAGKNRLTRVRSSGVFFGVVERPEGVDAATWWFAIGVGLDRFYTLSQDYGCVNRIRYFADRRAVVDLVNKRPL